MAQTQDQTQDEQPKKTYLATLRFEVEVELESDDPKAVNQALDDIRIIAPAYTPSGTTITSLLVTERHCLVNELDQEEQAEGGAAPPEVP